MDQSQIEQVRCFNRLMADSTGAIDDDFLGRGRPMGEARLLWEVDEGADVRDVRHRLGLDAGYTSRLIRSLRRQGLVELTTDVRDHRVRRVVPTAAGAAERRELDRRSDALATTLLEPLTTDERARLVAAMGVVARLVVRSRTTIELAAAESTDVRRCFEQYATELDQRFDHGFETGRSNRMDTADLTPPHGLVLLATIGHEAVGCGALMFLSDDVAELKRIWIAPRVRGMGLGRRMLRALEAQARRHGARVARLETNRNLGEAIAMYRAEGFREVPAFNTEPYAHHWFEKSLQSPGPA